MRLVTGNLGDNRMWVTGNDFPSARCDDEREIMPGSIHNAKERKKNRAHGIAPE
jgi:hypothetical protein